MKSIHQYSCFCANELYGQDLANDITENLPKIFAKLIAFNTANKQASHQLNCKK